MYTPSSMPYYYYYILVVQIKHSTAVVVISCLLTLTLALPNTHKRDLLKIISDGLYIDKHNKLKKHESQEV